ncbi:hypothetical protein D9758_003934 [Tetrapyrgos nigripes]|uniref:Vacuolar sorting protein 39/Transforming growth factor beta receptor-associated domain-containing protein n=1 Tax=Tetrapyrgos nigripes TaxID=182062 RepID=A0A8H5GLD6_9AGAR|nr:hypothetical protein D9758_003934 [Tetrapyrgos nigripes]
MQMLLSCLSCSMRMEQRRTRIRALNALAQFRAAKYDSAIDTFIELDLNPAKARCLTREMDRIVRWSCEPLQESKQPAKTTDHNGSPSASPRAGSLGAGAADILENIVGPGTGAIRGRFKGLNAFMATAQKDDDAASIHSQTSKIKHEPAPTDNLHRSVETLLRYLGDRRPKLAGALLSVGITPAAQAHKIAPLSETSVDELFAMPNAPLSALAPEQLQRFAQIVDTALFKSYLMVRPSLAGSLFRIPNWCEVEEVEGVLRSRQMFRDLKDLYNQKKMHRQALELLRQVGKRRKIWTIVYTTPFSICVDWVQSICLKFSNLQDGSLNKTRRWHSKYSSQMMWDLPRQEVADYLEKIDPLSVLRYLEYLIEEREEDSVEFHDRLAELYVQMTLTAKKRGDDETRRQSYDKLVKFIDSSQLYGVDRLTVRTAGDIARQVGRHDQALELYVYRLQDFVEAEKYCKKHYHPDGETKNVFLTLLRIYLRPAVNINLDLLQPALDLISRHSPRLDTVEALQLLPPMVTIQDIRTFLMEGLKLPRFDTSVVRQISKAHDDQASRRLMALQSRRVKVTDSRMYILSFLL